ncbi:MAG: VWA domain-containing protein, partial [Anaerolineales bacterium]|nr:VWA domain-containing protein [Anaerolineales bacterium]
MNKQLYGKKKIHLVQLIISSVLLVLSLAACSAAVETSKQRSRAVIDAGQIVPAEEIRVAEYLQYYDQHFPEPVEDSVGLDLRLGNYLMPEEGGMAWLQIGLQTRSEENEIVAPLNLALVIDCSGSMNDNDKMPYLKESMEIFLQSLDADDIVSIVGYNDKASVLLSAQKVGNRYWLQDVIDCIRPGGSTNLHAGLMEGFKQVDANYDIRRNNRVILLTDGIANRGVTDPDRIAADALSYNDRGIYLSTIGVGLDFNDSLLSRLARQGNSRYSFVDSTEEMDRIFREHVSSLTQRVASDVSVSVYPSVGVRLVGLTGLENVPSEGASISLWPLGTGDSTVVLAELQVQNVPGRTLQRNLARVKLQYYDEFA